MEVDHKKCLVWGNISAPLVLTAFGTAITPCKLRSQLLGDSRNFHSANLRDVAFNPFLLRNTLGIFQEHKAKSSFEIYTVDAYGIFDVSSFIRDR